VIEATSAYEALEAIGDTSSSIDVALLDFRLPDCTDLRLLEEVRRRVPGSAVVLMTRRNTGDGARRARSHYLHKLRGEP